MSDDGPTGDGADCGLVFISAKSEDYAHAQRVYDFLTGRGVNAFLSHVSLPQIGASDYRRTIDRRLEAASHVVVVTSSRSHVESRWVESEWGTFVNEIRSGRRQGNIVTLVVGGLTVADLPIALRSFEVMPLDDACLERLLPYVTARATRPAPSKADASGRGRRVAAVSLGLLALAGAAAAWYARGGAERTPRTGDAVREDAPRAAVAEPDAGARGPGPTEARKPPVPDAPRACGAVDLSRLPEDAVASWNGERLTSGRRLPPGRVEIVLERPGYEPQRIPAESAPDVPLVVVPLDWKPAAAAVEATAPPPAAPAPPPRPVVAAPPATALPDRVASSSSGATLRVVYAGAPPAPATESRPPALQFEILVKRAGETEFQVLTDGESLRSELDDYLLVARPMTAGYLYVFQIDSSGKTDWLFPKNARTSVSSGSNPVTARTVVQLPPQGAERVFFLDSTTGVEHLYCVLSATRWTELEDALAKPPPTSIQAAVREPNLLATRGVGGTRVVPGGEAAVETVIRVGDRATTFALTTPVQESSSFFLAVERWFRHLAR